MPPKEDESVPTSLSAATSNDQHGSAQLDHGLTPWLQVLGSFFLWLNIWGLINSFGQFQTYYTAHLPQSPSQISWIGSLQIFLMFFIGVLCAPIMDAGYCRVLVVAGNLLVVFGIMMTSLATQYWQLILSQGLTTGLGFGILFLPSFGTLIQYFTPRRRTLAISLATSAGGLGGVIYPILFHRLQPRLGFPWTVRIMGFVALFSACISTTIVRTRFTTPKSKPSSAVSTFLHNTPLLWFTTAYFFIFLAVYIPPVYIGTVSLETHVIGDSNLAFYLLPIMMASSALGRILLGYLADKLGVLNLCVLVTLSTCVLAAGWIGVVNEAGAIVFSVLYGFFLGSVVSLPSPGLAQLTPMELFNSHLGLASLITSLGVLVGTPIAGALLRSALEVAAIQAFTVAVLGVATLCFVATRVGKAR